MKRKSTETPTEIRRRQIEIQLEKLKATKKTQRDFRSEALFELWSEKYETKLRELHEERAMIDDPTDYNEIPLAVAAEELGITLGDMVTLTSDADLVDVSFRGEYQAGARITRDELARVIEVGPEALLRLAHEPVENIFERAVEFLHNGDAEGAERCLGRLERLGYVNPYWTACDIAVRFLKGDYHDLFGELSGFSVGDDDMDFIAILKALRKAVEGIKPTDHLSAVVQEQILAVADGKKNAPFDATYSRWRKSEPFSDMNENQRHAKLLCSVVLEAIHKYRLIKSIEKWRGFSDELRQDEFERVVCNAIYTALEAESSYYDSPSSKLFVDKFVELFPKRWIPAEHIGLLPRNVRPH